MNTIEDIMKAEGSKAAQPPEERAGAWYAWVNMSGSFPIPDGLTQEAVLEDGDGSPVSDARIFELIGEHTPDAVDPVRSLHAKASKSKRPFITLARVDRNTLRRLRRAAARELEALG